jgi:hypothetical protein
MAEMWNGKKLTLVFTGQTAHALDLARIERTIVKGPSRP